MCNSSLKDNHSLEIRIVGLFYHSKYNGGDESKHICFKEIKHYKAIIRQYSNYYG